MAGSGPESRTTIRQQPMIGRTVIHRPEKKTGRKGEWQYGDKVEESFRYRNSSNKGIGDNFRVIAIGA